MSTLTTGNVAVLNAAERENINYAKSDGDRGE